MRKCSCGCATPPRKMGNHTNHSSTKYWPRRCGKRASHYSLPRFRNSGNVEVWSDRIRDRYVVSVQAARLGRPPLGKSYERSAGSGGIKRLSECFHNWRDLRPAKQLELLERLDHWNRLVSGCID